MKNSKKGKGNSTRLKFEGRLADPFKFEPILDYDVLPNKSWVLAKINESDKEAHLA